jgi:hypothetical protein
MSTHIRLYEMEATLDSEEGWSVKPRSQEAGDLHFAEFLTDLLTADFGVDFEPGLWAEDEDPIYYPDPLEHRALMAVRAFGGEFLSSDDLSPLPKDARA